MSQFHVAVIGAGPAGLYAAKTLSEHGVAVSLFNRDIKPGGLAEYGIYHDKFKMKEGLRKLTHQFGSEGTAELITRDGLVGARAHPRSGGVGQATTCRCLPAFFPLVHQNP